MPYESFTVTQSPVVAHDSELGSIEDSRHHIEVAGESEGVSDEHLLGYIELRDVDGVIAGKGGEEFVGMLDVIFSEAYAAVEAVDFSDFEYRTGNRCGGPRGQAHKSGRRYEEIRREIVGYRPG